MKFVIVLALVAVAAAEQIKVAHLPRGPANGFHMPDLRPLIIPQAVIDAIKAAQPVQAVVETDEGLKVNFVDAPLDVAPVAEEIEAPQDAAMSFIAPKPVKLAEPAIPTVESVIAPEPVVLPEAPLPAVETVKVAPLFVVESVIVPEPVMFVDAPLPAIETVKVASPEFNLETAKLSPPRFPIKQYADPMWR